MALNGDAVSENIAARSTTATDTDTSTVTAPHKRKREDSHNPESSAARNKQIQIDLLQLLARHDTSPSFLQHILRHDTASSEPNTKKARLSDPSSDASTIAAKLSGASYSSLRSLTADASRVSEDLISSIRSKSKDNLSGGRPAVEDLKLIKRIQHLEAMLKELVAAEDNHAQEHDDDHDDDGEEHGLEQVSPAKTTDRRVGTVLTLFGNAPTPKQLFSSVQNLSSARKDAAIKEELPVDEMSLPNGITATKIVPVSANGSDKGPTFEETFAPPYSLAPLNPPKPQKRSTTRDTTLKWEFKDPIQRNSRKGGYTVQSLTVAKWLGYGGVDPLSDSTRERRKQRDRALSGGEERDPTPTQASLDDALAKEEAALFRRAYSSYAPTCDNSNVVVPEVEKNAVWWSKVGHKRFNAVFAIDPALLDEQLPSVSPMIADETEQRDLNDEELQRVIQDLDEIEATQPETEPVKSMTDVDNVLHQISELLETLASHQRIRNATLPPASASRVPISPGPISSKIGKSDEPSEDEIATYSKLRHEIAYLVLKLPPYAVAKLDGDQLAHLGVSTLLTFHAKDVRGTLEEDLVTRQQKYAASQTAQSLATLSGRPNSSAGQHYTTTAQRTPAIGQAANTRHGHQYAGGRPPVSAPSFGRSTSSQQSYGTPGAQRSYGNTNSYTRPGASYNQTNGGNTYYQQPQRPLQTATSNFGSLSQFQQPSSQQSRTPTFPPSYPARSQGVANYPINNNHNSTNNNNASALNRTASPAQQGSYSSPMLPAQQNLALAQQRQQGGGMYSGQQQPQQHQAQQGGGSGSGRATPVNGYPPTSGPNTPVNTGGGYAPPSQQQQQQQQQQGYQRNIPPRPMSGTSQPSGTMDTTTTTTSGDNDMMAGGGVGGEGGVGGGQWCHYCEEMMGPRESLVTHRCEVLRCRKCNKHYTYREVFKKHVDGCVG